MANEKNKLREKKQSGHSDTDKQVKSEWRAPEFVMCVRRTSALSRSVCALASNDERRDHNNKHDEKKTDKTKQRKENKGQTKKDTRC